jgi:mono/diheme cytochrome c family protein
MVNFVVFARCFWNPGRRALVVACMLTFGTAAVLVAGGQTGRNSNPKTLKNPVQSTPTSIASGQGTFQRFCTRCHGPEGKGDGPQAPEGSHPANLTDAQWDHGGTDGEIFTTIHDGVPPKYDMDSYEGKVTDTEIWNLVNYLRSIGPKPDQR